MNRRGIFLAALLICAAMLMVWLQSSRRPTEQPTDNRQRRGSNIKTDTRQIRPLALMTPAQTKTWSLLSSAGLVRESVRESACAVLEQAVATACFCETQRRELAGSSNGWAISTVEAYSMKVFKDDFAFAANLAPEWIDCAQAEAVFAVANERMKGMSDADLDEIASAASRQPPRESSSKTIADRYALLLAGHDQLGPAFSNVLQTTRALVPGLEPTASDLFKDAALYVGEMSVLRNFEAKTAQHMRVHDRAPDNLPAETVDAMRRHYEEINAKNSARLQQAHDVVATMEDFRFRTLFHITNSTEVLKALEKLSLPEGAGQIDIPCPD